MSVCSKCGSQISFRQTPSGKWSPTESDGTSHFDKCSERSLQNFRNGASRFSNKAGHGIEKKGVQKWLMRVGRTTKRTDFSLVACDCKTPPWEHCEHTLKVAF